MSVPCDNLIADDSIIYSLNLADVTAVVNYFETKHVQRTGYDTTKRWSRTIQVRGGGLAFFLFAEGLSTKVESGG